MDGEYYDVANAATKKQCAQHKQYLVKKHLPRGLSKCVRFHERNIPYGYHNYKEKRLLWSGGLKCNAEHSHEREIISDALSPIKGHLRLIARAIRLIKKLSGDFCWTLWNPSQIADVLGVGSEKCCGKAKQKVTMAKFDAAQFFK